jgi:hypothetical protein
MDLLHNLSALTDGMLVAVTMQLIQDDVIGLPQSYYAESPRGAK